MFNIVVRYLIKKIVSEIEVNEKETTGVSDMSIPTQA